MVVVYVWQTLKSSRRDTCTYLSRFTKHHVYRVTNVKVSSWEDSVLPPGGVWWEKRLGRAGAPVKRTSCIEEFGLKAMRESPYRFFS